MNDTKLLQPVGTNVPKGDQDKQAALESTQTSSYVTQPRSYMPYDKSIVVENLRKTNFTLIDGLGTFDKYRSTATDSYKPTPQKGKCRIIEINSDNRRLNNKNWIFTSPPPPPPPRTKGLFTPSERTAAGVAARGNTGKEHIYFNCSIHTKQCR